MARKTIRIDIPIGKPDETVKLCEGITEKHTALGAGSPLTAFFDMALFAAKTSDVKTKRKKAKESDALSQSQFNQCTVKCGIAKGQNKQTTGTLYVMVCSIRDFLLLKFRETPEQLSQWGFNVVITQTGGRRNVAVEIPIDTPENLLTLCDAISAKHILDGATSILDDSEVDMTIYTTMLGEANTFLNTSETQNEISQSTFEQALVIMGYGEGQTAETPGTLYNFITGIRDRLLNKHAGTEEMLSEYGYKVVIGTSNLPEDEPPPAPPV